MAAAFSELLGTFFLVLVAVGGGMVNARFGGHAVPAAARVTAPALMVAAIILFMGTVSGAHLNPAVSAAFALRGDFPWKRVPAYIVAQFAGAALATLLLWALIGKQGSAGLTLPGSGISTATAMLWEAVLTAGLVSVILGTRRLRRRSARWPPSPSAATSRSPGCGEAGQRRLDEPGPVAGPALVLGDWTAWWAYLAGPAIGAVIAVGIAYVLRGPGGGLSGSQAAEGTLGVSWRPGRIGVSEVAPAGPSYPAAARPRRRGPPVIRKSPRARVVGRTGHIVRATIRHGTRTFSSRW